MMKKNKISNEEWQKVNAWNKEITEEFLQQGTLSYETLNQYESALKHFFVFVKDKCNNKPLYELKPRDALKYQNFLVDQGLSSAGIKLKRSVVSSLCNFVELYYDEEYPSFRNIFNNKVPPLPNNPRTEKQPLTINEYKSLIKELEKQNRWQELAYLKMSYSTGGRRAEVLQLRKEIVNYEKIEEANCFISHELRGKGKGREGKKIRLLFDDDAKKAVEKWLNVRGEDDCEYIFVSKNKKGEAKQLNVATFNYWCSEIFSKILGRRLYPHLIRSTRATHLVNEGVPIKSVQELLSHESPDTTSIYVVEDKSDLIGNIFNK